MITKPETALETIPSSPTILTNPQPSTIHLKMKAYIEKFWP